MKKLRSFIVYSKETWIEGRSIMANDEKDALRRLMGGKRSKRVYFKFDDSEFQSVVET